MVQCPPPYKAGDWEFERNCDFPKPLSRQAVAAGNQVYSFSVVCRCCCSPGDCEWGSQWASSQKHERYCITQRWRAQARRSGRPGWGASPVAQWQWGDAGSTPGLGRSPGGGHGNPLQYSFFENPMDRGAWGATVLRVTKRYNWATEYACMQTRVRFFFRPCSMVYGILIPWPGIKPMPPALGVWSGNHSVAREVPGWDSWESLHPLIALTPWSSFSII